LHPTYIVYLDVLFITNFILDYGILWATARLGHLATTWFRLGLGALLGSLYAMFMVFPRASFFYSMSIKLLFSLLIVAVAFSRLTLKKYFQAVAYFYLISFAMAGAVIGGSSILEGNSFVFQRLNVKTTGLVFACVTAFILGKWGVSYLKRNWQKNQFRVSTEICFDRNSILLEALIDTGNELRDPLSQKPVMIVEYEAIKNILPKDFRYRFEKYAATDITKVVEPARVPSWLTRVRLIPFNSIGKHHGMLLGFKPDMVVMFSQEKVITKDVIVCLYHKPLSSRGSYRAVLNPEMLEAAA